MTDSKASAMVNGLVDKSKELQKEILMEKLRSKTSQNKNLTETSKAVRMALLDKRWAVDSQDRMILQKCLDSLQHCIKVSSLQNLIERLECLTRQLGLKFVVGTSGVNFFISSDMFYLEILVESSGSVKDVKIHHEGKIEQQSCEELVSCISRGDFADFTAQLEGLIAVYQLNAEKKVKCKAFNALQSLEEDLCTMRQLQSFIKDPWPQVHKSPIGFLQKRRGGHAMRLTYFVSPYELLDKDKGLQPLTTELLTIGKPAVSTGMASLVAPSHTPVGHSALVLLESSTANKLQLSPIISSSQRPGKGGPVYAQLVPQNSAMLPACFTLKLSQPTPLCSALAKLIQATTEVEVAGDWANAKPIIGLVAQQAYNKLTPGKTIELNLSKGLFVSLPEQTQCYFLCESRGLEGCTVTSIPFTHPSHVPPLLACLRQQALFNTLIASCVRLQTKYAVDLESVVMFEVTALSWQHISVSLEHPLDESMATVELQLSEPAAPRAAVHALHAPPSAHVDDYITRVLQRTHSIPVTLRSLVKIWEREAAAKQLNGGYSALDSANFNMGVGGLDPGGGARHVKQDGGRPALYPAGVNHPHHAGQYLSDSQHQLSMLCADGDAKPPEERRAGKRKAEQDPWSAHKQSTPGGDSASDSDNSDPYVSVVEQYGSNSSDEILCDESSVSVAEAASDAECGSPGPGRAPPDDDASDGAETDDSIRNSFHKSDHKRQKLKSKEDSRGRNLLLELTEGKSFMPSSVSITPIGGAGAGAGAGAGLAGVLALERRPGIELIPLSGAAPPALPSSITITPISPCAARSLDERRERRPRPDERARERRRKRRRDDVPAPAPAPRADPLTKPVSVSIKPHDPAPHAGKPSMSALKAAAPPDAGRKPKDARDKERKHAALSFAGAGGRSSPKPKHPLKLKALEVSPGEGGAEALTSPPAEPRAVPSAQRNRKGSLSAVIDKLKSAQHSADAPPRAAAAPPRPSDKTQEYMVKPSSDGMKITINKTGRSKDAGGSKPSYKQSSPQLTPPSQGSPKTHTGLKPGVISGPASKKTQAMQQSKAGSTPPKASTSPSDSPNMSKVPYSKSSNTGINLSKSATKPSSGSPKSGGTDLSKAMRDRERDKPKAKLASNSDRSIFANKSERHSSPSGSRDDVDGDRYKASKDASNFLVEGLIKPLDTSKFQIPKLKNQTTPDKNSPVSQYDSRSMVNDFARTLEQNKYSNPYYDNPNSRTPESIQKSAYPLTVPKPLLNMGSVSPKTVPPVKGDQANPIEYTKLSESISKERKESPPYPLPLDFKTELKGFTAPKGPEERAGAEAVMKPPASGALARSGATTPQEAAEMLLDFSSSSSKVSGLVAVRPVLEPLVAPSPHAGSPAITDDELADEGLVGPGK